ncbi:MAG TPA: hypothetical protein VLA34_07055, partial [Candidatus Krumholzibacterium sp.]|nr:hypothetical protein [Candidatus Krumholzibacterium sp.]
MEIDAHRVFSPHLARQYWKRLKERWMEAGRMAERSILSIPDEQHKKIVALMVDACAKRKGAYVLKEAPEGFNVAEVELEDEVIDEILDITNGDTEPLDMAYDWIVELLKGMPAPFVAWAFGELILQEPILNEKGESLKFFAFDRVVYSLEEGKILGIHSHPVFSHPKNKIIPVDL